MISIQGLTKTYTIFPSQRDRLLGALFGKKNRRATSVHAINDVSLNIPQGQSVALVGRNGAGKSTLLKLIVGELQPSAGRIEISGRVSLLADLNSGLIPELTGEQNISAFCAATGQSREEAEVVKQYVVDFSELAEKLKHPIKTYSTGMKARLGFSLATAAAPDILIIDEVLAVGDIMFRRKCIDRINQLKHQGVTILFVSHSEGAIRQLCERSVLLENGAVVADGKTDDVLRSYHARTGPSGAPASGTSRKPEKTSSNKGSPSPTFARFNHSLRPKTTTEYPQNGARIFDVGIWTLDGRKTNVLTPGQVYSYEYWVEFAESVDRVAFGLQMHTEMGMTVVAANSELEPTNAPANETLRVRWRFRCNLLQGIYYGNCGVTQVDRGGSHTFLHRIKDAVAFQVERIEDASTKGIIYVEPKLTISLTETDETTWNE